MDIKVQQQILVQRHVLSSESQVTLAKFAQKYGCPFVVTSVSVKILFFKRRAIQSLSTWIKQFLIVIVMTFLDF